MDCAAMLALCRRNRQNSVATDASVGKLSDSILSLSEDLFLLRVVFLLRGPSL